MGHFKVINFFFVCILPYKEICGNMVFVNRYIYSFVSCTFFCIQFCFIFHALKKFIDEIL